MKNNFEIGFVGLSHLGLNYLAAAAQKKYSVIGIHRDRRQINEIKKLNLPFSEPKLKNLLRKNRKKIFFSDNFEYLKKCKIVFVSQDVITNTQNQARVKDIYKLVYLVKKKINKKCILVILSQLRPGFMSKINFENSRLYYQVETLIFGQAVDRALFPERIIVGCSKEIMKINPYYLKFLKRFNCPIIKMSYQSAEVTKIALNIFLASSITTTNILAETCKLSNGDWEEIKPALKLDKRIGQKAYVNPGLGISGGNIERDIISLNKMITNNLNLKKLTDTILSNSQYMKSWVLRNLKKEKIFNNKKNIISILGLAYKKNTSSIKNSPTIHLLNFLKRRIVKVFDPKAKLDKRMVNCEQKKSIKDAMSGARILIIMTPWNNFKKIKINKKIKLIIDPYRVINKNLLKRKNINYYCLGK